MAPSPKPSFVRKPRRAGSAMSLASVGMRADRDGHAVLRAGAEARSRRRGGGDSAEEGGAVRGEARVVHLGGHGREVGTARGDAVDEVPARLIADIHRDRGATHVALVANALPASL